MAHTQSAPAALAGAPFSALSFIPARSATSRARPSYWAPRGAKTYEQASEIGRQCARELVEWMRANDRAVGEALLIWTLGDAYSARQTLVQRGYRAGFVAELARAVIRGGL